ncbi:MAG: serine/threonine protein kinase [Myxococcaceae bacterium]|nr:MAG: serine/threonine protein kinase [Myxococcaceae bacterium]
MSIEPTHRGFDHSPGRIGRYEMLTPLGHGGMASVYLVRRLGSAGFERLAAMKVLHRGLCDDQEFVEMFLDEARVAARLHHPNTAAIIDLGSNGPQPYMVMDYVEGDTLDAVQRAASAVRRAVPVGIALRITLDALAGLDAAHNLEGPDGAPLGLIHRDVSPHNLLVGVDGVARLVDFGIARAASRRGVTAIGVIKGNVPFMAPEQLRGYGVDRRADVFSMGVTLWETLSLRRCFPTREGSPLSRMAREDYRPLAEVAPKVPAALDAICRKALAFDPDDRFDSAAAFASAIEEAFRHDVATQRELAQFMSMVAANKVWREREAVRLSSQLASDRLDDDDAVPTQPEAARRGRFAPIAASTNNPDRAADHGFFDPETHSPSASWRRRARNAGQTLRTWALATAPTRVSTRRFGAPPPAAHAGSLFEAVTEALFRRRRMEMVVPAPAAELETRRMTASRELPDAFASVVTRRVARLSVRPRAALSSRPAGLDAPTLPRPAVRIRALTTFRTPAPHHGLLAPLRALVARLWSRLAF